MGSILTASNAKKAGALALVNYIAMAVTAGQNKWLQGAAIVAANAVALPFVAKL